MITWEEAVETLRCDPEKAALVKACYYDDPLADAAKRFAGGEEWNALQAWLPPRGSVLELGAGRGIASWAFAKDGWRTTALEPDPSALVGAEAIRSLSRETGVPIEVVENWGESLPFDDASFDLVYGRAVFHHAGDLDAFCREAHRVLRPAGRLILTREHVLSKENDLAAFLKAHPLHELYGGEAAYTLQRYLEALGIGGFKTINVIGPKSSPVNYFPEARSSLESVLRKRRRKRIGRLRSLLFPVTARAIAEEAIRWENQITSPGRLYSFVAEKGGAL